MSELVTAARPYARAVFELASADKRLPEWSDALELIAGIAMHAEMIPVLDNPALTRQQKSDVIIAVAGDQLDQQAQNLLKVMAENDRLMLLPEVAALYEKMRADAEGSVEAELISAYEVTPEQQQSIADSLKKRLGRDVRLDVQIDKDLLGGVIVKAGDLVIDGSIKGRLEQLTSALSR